LQHLILPARERNPLTTPGHAHGRAQTPAAPQSWHHARPQPPSQPQPPHLSQKESIMTLNLSSHVRRQSRTEPSQNHQTLLRPKLDHQLHTLGTSWIPSVSERLEPARQHVYESGKRPRSHNIYLESSRATRSADDDFTAPMQPSNPIGGLVEHPPLLPLSPVSSHPLRPGSSTQTSAKGAALAPPARASSQPVQSHAEVYSGCRGNDKNACPCWEDDDVTVVATAAVKAASAMARESASTQLRAARNSPVCYCLPDGSIPDSPVAEALSRVVLSSAAVRSTAGFSPPRTRKTFGEKIVVRRNPKRTRSIDHDHTVPVPSVEKLRRASERSQSAIPVEPRKLQRRSAIGPGVPCATGPHIHRNRGRSASPVAPNNGGLAWTGQELSRLRSGLRRYSVTEKNVKRVNLRAVARHIGSRLVAEVRKHLTKDLRVVQRQNDLRKTKASMER
jgi:hypothetical protein